jgi:hypothetical protein
MSLTMSTTAARCRPSPPPDNAEAGRSIFGGTNPRPSRSIFSAPAGMIGASNKEEFEWI